MGTVHRAIVIDPHERKLSEVETELNLIDLHRLVRCDTVTAIYFEDHTLWLDDNGLLYDKPLPIFTVKGYHQPLAGVGLVTGREDETGALTGATIPLQTMAEAVEWPDIEFDHMTEESGRAGPGSFFVRVVPHFRPKRPTE